LLDKEMDEVGIFVEIKNANCDKGFEKLSTGWEQEKSKRARLRSCKEFENALKNFLVHIDKDPDSNLKLFDIGVMHAISSQDAQQILQRSLANTPRENLQRISRMAAISEHERQLIAEAEEQLRTPRVDLMDDACLLAWMKFPSLSVEIRNLFLAESRKRSGLAHKSARSALVKNLVKSTPNLWLHGVIVFLDQERCANVFDAAAEDKYDGWNVLNNMLNELKAKENYSAKEALKAVSDSLNAMRPAFKEMQTNEFQKQEFYRLCAGVEGIISNARFDPLTTGSGDATKNRGEAIKSAVLDYLDIPLPTVTMRRLTRYAEEFYEIESRQQAFEGALRRPSLNSEGDLFSEGDLLLVCEQFRKDVNRSNIVIDGQFFDNISGIDTTAMSRTFVQRLQLMQATDAQITTISRLASQSTSNSYFELCNTASLYRLTSNEAKYIKNHEGGNLCLNPFANPNMHHIISHAGDGAIKVRSILSNDRIEHLLAGDCFLITNPEKTSYRAEFEFIVDQYGQISRHVSLSEHSSREITGVVQKPVH
jgi:hypothetical protein